MWILPILVIGAIFVAAASKSPREAASPARQLAAPGTSGLPGPIAVLGEVLRIGQYPSPTVILCAIAEAEAIGRRDLASDIVSTFVAPVVYQHQIASAKRAQVPARARSYERGSCALSCSPRAQADFASSCAPRRDVGSCAPLARARTAPETAPTAAVQQVADRQPTEDEILTMLHSDPNAFLSMIESQRGRRGPLVEIFPIGTPPPTSAAQSPLAASPPVAPVVPAPTANADVLAEQLLQVPGSAGAGILLVDPSTGEEVFEVRWLRGYQTPPLPQVIDGRPVRLVVVDDLPVARPTDLPPETVAQMQEAAGLHEAADQTRAMAPGSPLPGVPDDAWRQFVALLERESPTFSSSRHVGQYRQHRDRLAELGIDPQSIHGSAAAQRAALDADLADAYHHAAEGGLLSEHLRRSIAVPGHEGSTPISLSGLLGVIQCAGLEGAVGWLERASDRKRYPHTTQAFLRTNGAF